MKYASSVRPTLCEVIEQMKRTVCALRNAHFDNLRVTTRLLFLTRASKSELLAAL
jgi:hypothetical protein